MVDISLIKRSGQASPITPAEFDANMTTIEEAFATITNGQAGTVTSVGLSLPASILNVTVATITTTGNLTAVLTNQSANRILSGPVSGADTAPTFRVLVAADLPTIPIAKGGTGAVSFTASRAVVSDGSGNLTVSATTAVEMAFVSGVTSSIQAQLDAKQATITVLAINKGGTAGATAQAARLNLLPSIATNGNKTLKVNAGATDVEWVTVTGIASINADTTAVQTIVSGDAGSTLAVATLAGVTTISIPSMIVTGVTRGLLTNTAQVIPGQKTFPANPILSSLTDKYVAYFNASKEISGSAGFEYNEAISQLSAKSFKITEQQVVTAFNSTVHTANYNISNVTDNIVYMDTTALSRDVVLPLTTDPSTILGTIFRIVKTTTANSVIVKATAGDFIDDGIATTVTIAGTKGWVEIQACKAGLYRILSSNLS